MSRAFGGGTTGNQYAIGHAMSADGRHVLMDSFATDLVAGLTDSNGNADVYVHDRATGTTRLVSSAAGTTTTTANGESRPEALSRDADVSHATGGASFVSPAWNAEPLATLSVGTPIQLEADRALGGLARLMRERAG